MKRVAVARAVGRDLDAEHVVDAGRVRERDLLPEERPFPGRELEPVDAHRHARWSPRRGPCRSLVEVQDAPPRASMPGRGRASAPSLDGNEVTPVRTRATTSFPSGERTLQSESVAGRTAAGGPPRGRCTYRSRRLPLLRTRSTRRRWPSGKNSGRPGTRVPSSLSVRALSRSGREEHEAVRQCLDDPLAGPERGRERSRRPRGAPRERSRPSCACTCHPWRPRRRRLRGTRGLARRATGRRPPRSPASSGPPLRRARRQARHRRRPVVAAHAGRFRPARCPRRSGGSGPGRRRASSPRATPPGARRRRTGESCSRPGNPDLARHADATRATSRCPSLRESIVVPASLRSPTSLLASDRPGRRRSFSRPARTSRRGRDRPASPGTRTFPSGTRGSTPDTASP